MTQTLATPEAWTWLAGFRNGRVASHVSRNIRVTMQLASRQDRDDHGLAARLIASAVESDDGDHSYSIVAPIHIDDTTSRPRMGEATAPEAVPRALASRMKAAIDCAWRTAKGVDLVDERGRPLLLGSLKEHPAGVSRWLTYYLQEGR